MFGAILGDMIGAPYEFDRGGKTKDFPLFCSDSQFTDDSVMTIAVAEALMDTLGLGDEAVRQALVRSMQAWGHRYPDAGYGGRFYGWLRARNPRPYGSFGNGSAMRVSAAGWLFNGLEETRRMARLTAEVTHNHPEGIKGAEAVASAIYLARTGHGKDEIRDYIVREFGYDLSRTCDDIRPTYHHVESCQETVPEAVTAFLEGADFEDVIRTAVSLGGDCDTLTCIAGSIAEAFYGVPPELIEACRARLPEEMLEVLDRFQQAIHPMEDPFLAGNEAIEDAIDRYHRDGSGENHAGVMEAIHLRMRADGHFLVPVLRPNDRDLLVRTLRTPDGKLWMVAFTSRREYAKGPTTPLLSNFIDTTLKPGMDDDVAGFILNPWGKTFMLVKELIGTLFKADAEEEEDSEDEAPVIDDNPFHKAWDDDSPRPIATRSDWKAEPMPERHVDFQMRRHIPPEQMAYLRRGNIPREMEDKWFWYMEGNTLYAHRSWTGICVFILRFDPDSDAIQVTVNRDPEQFGSKSVEEDMAQIDRLLDWWTQPEYDYYHEWLSETLQALEKRDAQEKE